MQSQKFSHTSPSTLPLDDSPTASESLAGNLVGAALVLWTASLALPSFVVESRVGIWYGLMTMLFGILFGWAVVGWAAYSNLFFLYAVVRFYAGKRAPYAVLWMVLSAATVYGFRGVIRDEGSGSALPVVSWGWGALLWGYSILLLALAHLAHLGNVGRKSVQITLATMCASAIALGSIGMFQRHNSNLQEIERYFPWGIAFATTSPSKLPFVWPDEAVIPEKEAVAFDIDADLSDQRARGDAYLPLPKPSVLRQYGADWIVYGYMQPDELKIKTDSSTINYVLQAQKTADGALLTILNIRTGQILYEQPLRVISIPGRNPRYVPEGSPWESGKYGVTDAISRALGTPPSGPQIQRTVNNEITVERCTPIAQTGQIDGLYMWDSRDVIMKSDGVKPFTSFCSPNYIALAEVRNFTRPGIDSDEIKSTSNLRAKVKLLDRATLAHIADYYDGMPWNCRADCSLVDSALVRGVRLTNTGAVVLTESGEVPVEKRTK